MPGSMGPVTTIYLIAVGSFLGLCAFLSLLPKKRSELLRPGNERVVVLGGSSGIGKAIALQYARRGARVWVVARRDAELAQVREECEAEVMTLLKRQRAEAHVKRSIAEDFVGRVQTTTADVSSVDDLVRLRESIILNWGGLDTLVLSTGMSSLQPLLSIAGVDPRAEKKQDTTTEGIERVRNVVKSLSEANYVSGVITAATFVPFLERTSLQPSILVISSAAALIPAPTRSIYCSSKAASLSFFQALSVEHSRISFTFVLPGTVNTAFRASAQDGVVPADPERAEKKLQPEEVARGAIEGVDNGTRMVWMPKVYGTGHLLYYLGFRWFIEGQARKKYHFA